MSDILARRGRRIRVALLVAFVIAAASGLVVLERWWVRSLREEAFRKLSRHDFKGAQADLSRVVSWSRRDGEAWFQLGNCESRLRNQEAAKAAWDSVPIDSPFAGRAAVGRARQELAVHRLADAERYLLRAVGERGPHGVEAFETLLHLYKIEGRFREAQRLVPTWCDAYPNRIAIAREMSQLEMPSPYSPEKARAALERAGLAAPEDDRVWLGKANLAIRTGDFKEAERWLERCERRRPRDEAVGRARIALAVSMKDSETVSQVVAHLDPGALDPDELDRLRAWFAAEVNDVAAERDALRSLLATRADDTRALERLAELEILAGQSSESSRLRARKAEIDRARLRYESLLFLSGSRTPNRDMARLAEMLGRSVEARACWQSVLDREPDDPEGRKALAELSARNRSAIAPRASLDALRAELARAKMKTERDPPAVKEQGPHAQVRFDDDAESSGLRFRFDPGASEDRQLPETMSGGVGVLDFDGDGRLDVYCVQGGKFPPAAGEGGGDRLFHNRGDGTFEDATTRSGIGPLTRGYGHGVAVGDYDGDGDPDVFLTRWRAYMLLRNRGDGTFEDATEAAGLGGERGWPTSSALADLDDDGDLDLYVAHYLELDAEHPEHCAHRIRPGVFEYCYPQKFPAQVDHLFRNDGGRFRDVTAEAGIVDHDGRGLGVVAADLDEDGKVDLYVTNDTTANFLFRNLGGMRFEEVGDAAGLASNAGGGYQGSMGIACGDLDGDGRLDLAVTNFFGESMTYYHDMGRGLFVDHTAAVGLLSTTHDMLGFGTAFLDADDDGRLDLAVTNGHVNDLTPESPYAMPCQLFLGSDEGRLIDVTNACGAAVPSPRVGRALAVGDLDDDGREDVLVVSQDRPLAYFHNKSDAGRSLVVELEGARSNRDAVGARVTLKVADRRLVRYLHGGGSYQSSSDHRICFGLGASEEADSVEVQWPSGKVERHEKLAAGSRYRLKEGAEKPVRATALRPRM